MTSSGADGPLELQFSIDDHPGVLRATDISAALGLRIPPRNSEGYRAWAHPPHREMVRALVRDAIAGPALCAEEGSDPGGALPDLGEILVQPL